MPADPEIPLTLSRDERAAGEMLQRRRPRPRAAFESALRRRLNEEDPGWGPRPPRLVRAIWAHLGVSAALLALAALLGLGVF